MLKGSRPAGPARTAAIGIGAGDRPDPQDDLWPRAGQGRWPGWMGGFIGTCTNPASIAAPADVSAGEGSFTPMPVLNE